MSSHPFGPKPHLDLEHLKNFTEAVAAYSLARERVLTFEIAKAEHPERFSAFDTAQMAMLDIEKYSASEAVKAQALILRGCGILDRCAALLEAQS